jgi:hypothetical protein
MKYITWLPRKFSGLSDSMAIMAAGAMWRSTRNLAILSMRSVACCSFISSIMLYLCTPKSFHARAIVKTYTCLAVS